MEIGRYWFLFIQLKMNINPTPQQKRSLEKMMKERYKVKDKFYDLKKYVPELIDGVIDEWEKK